ncbi:MAG: hypothetical protein EXS09_20160 [Gemmataceae bacterium]|nr:hypothetical protein [Gemmataceae bacterium]
MNRTDLIHLAQSIVFIGTVAGPAVPTAKSATTRAMAKTSEEPGAVTLAELPVHQSSKGTIA